MVSNGVREYLTKESGPHMQQQLRSLENHAIRAVRYRSGADGTLLVALGWDVHEAQEVVLDLEGGRDITLTWAPVGYVEGLAVGNGSRFDRSVAVDVNETPIWRERLGLTIREVEVIWHDSGRDGEVAAVWAAVLRWDGCAPLTIALGELFDGDEAVSYMPDTLAVMRGERGVEYARSPVVLPANAPGI